MYRGKAQTMRLIGADALGYEVLEEYGADGGSNDVNVIYGMIINAPTVDAVEVVKDMLKGEMRLIDAGAVQGDRMSNQRVIEWVPIRERKPHLPGIYIVTAKTYDGTKETGRTLSTGAYFRQDKFMLDGVLAWAEMPAVWTDEQEQLTLF